MWTPTLPKSTEQIQLEEIVPTTDRRSNLRQRICRLQCKKEKSDAIKCKKKKSDCNSQGLRIQNIGLQQQKIRQQQQEDKDNRKIFRDNIKISDCNSNCNRTLESKISDCNRKKIREQQQRDRDNRKISRDNIKIRLQYQLQQDLRIQNIRLQQQKIRQQQQKDGDNRKIFRDNRKIRLQQQLQSDLRIQNIGPVAHVLRSLGKKGAQRGSQPQDQSYLRHSYEFRGEEVWGLTPPNLTLASNLPSDYTFLYSD